MAIALAATACSSGTDSANEVEPTSTTEEPSAPVTEPVPVTAETGGGPITIETELDFESGPPAGTFAVAEGAELLGCGSGSVVEDGGPEGITNTFTCEDGAREGTFIFQWQIIEGSEGPGDVNGPWRVLDATGEFSGLTGDGLWSGVVEGETGFGSFPGAIEFGPVDTEAESANGSVESFLADRLEDVYFPDDFGGVMVAIMEPGAPIVHVSRAPDADAPAIEPDDLFRVGSISKVFTSALTLSLVEDGLVDLDQPAADYITRIAVPEGVSVRHLLGHRSGISNYTNEEFFEQTGADDGRIWTPEEVFAVIADEPAEFEPGADFSYSNTNYILLGTLIEEVTGEAYHDALRARILEPAAMTDTYVDGVEKGAEVADAYSGFFTESPALITADYTAVATGAWSAGALVSTPADLHLFFTALFDGELISDELLEEMTAAPEGYGLGIEVNPRELGDGLYGHGGSIMGFNTMVIHAPETGRTGFWVATSDGVEPHSAIVAAAPLLESETLESGIDPGSDSDAPKWEQGRDALLPVGTIRLPELGGIQFELDEERQVIQEGPAFTILLHDDDEGSQPAEVDLIAPTATSSDEPLTTIEALMTALTDDVGAELSPIGEVTTSIGVARGFEYTVEDQDSLDRDVAWLQVGDGGWGPYPFGEFWLIDTERGLFMVTAEAIEKGPLLDDAIVTAARLLETIEFADLDLD